VARGALAGVLEKIEEGDQDEPYDHPQGEIPEIRVHFGPYGAAVGGPRLPISSLLLKVKIGARRYEANKKSFTVSRPDYGGASGLSGR
jgi:hypothetical protein